MDIDRFTAAVPRHDAGSAALRFPADAVKPEYGSRGLFGLAGAIREFLDGGKWRGTTPAADSPSRQRLIFLLIDGLGDLFLQRHGQDGALLAHRAGRLTSVFPSTTACAVTTLVTGLAPSMHGLTGWYIHDSRFGGVLAPLPMKMRGGGALVDERSAERLFPYDGLFVGRARPTIEVAPEQIAFSPFSRWHGRGGKTLPYRDIDDMLTKIVAACESFGAGGGYVYAYYSVFDAVCHDHGCESVQAREAFWRIDQAFAMLCEKLRRSEAHLVVSADHGFIDSPVDRQIDMERLLEVRAMLESPLFGERRAAFCRVRAAARRDFEQWAGEALRGKGVCVDSAALLKTGWFGPPPFHPRIHERIGTHALLMEPGWTIYDRLPGETPHPMIGVHGGVTPQEMWVPLIEAQP